MKGITLGIGLGKMNKMFKPIKYKTIEKNKTLKEFVEEDALQDNNKKKPVPAKDRQD